MQNIGIYKDIALSQIPRILGLGDRNKNSKTYGCFDRYYWHYNLVDFPNARFQEVALLLALLYKNNFKGNIYYKNKKILEWGKAAINFWARIQNNDGSLNEAYPYEHGFCVTSFSTYAITEAILTLDLQDIPIKINKTADWLVKNNNFNVSNQIAATCIALYNIYLITGKKKYRIASEEKIKQLIKMRISNGFFPEYGGFDLGYSSIVISCLAHYYKKSHDKNILRPLTKEISIIENKIRKDGSYDSTRNSRKTQFLYPCGFAIMHSNIIKKHINGLKNNKILNPSWMDDRYVIPITTDYLQTYLEERNVNDN